jgi:DNA-binding protein HU-beta
MKCKHGMSNPEYCSLCKGYNKQGLTGLNIFYEELSEKESEESLAELEKELEEQEKKERELENEEKEKKYQKWLKKEKERMEAKSEAEFKEQEREWKREYKEQLRQEAKEQQELLDELEEDEKHREEEEWEDILDELLEEHDKKERRKKEMRNKRNMPASKKPITKSQIVAHFAKKFEISKKMASSIIDEMGMLAIAETKKAGAFAFPGVGKLVLYKRKARKGFNPATGESIKIPTKTVLKMRIAKTCKEAIVPLKKK